MTAKALTSHEVIASRLDGELPTGYRFEPSFDTNTLMKLCQRASSEAAIAIARVGKFTIADTAECRSQFSVDCRPDMAAIDEAITVLCNRVRAATTGLALVACVDLDDQLPGSIAVWRARDPRIGVSVRVVAQSTIGMAVRAVAQCRMADTVRMRVDFGLA